MIIGLGFITWFTFVLLFTPRIDYRVTVPLRCDSDEFVHVIQSTCQAAIHVENRVEDPGHLDRCWLPVDVKRDVREATIRGEIRAA